MDEKREFVFLGEFGLFLKAFKYLFKIFKKKKKKGIMAGRSKRITGVVSAISKKGTVKLDQYGKWAKVLETNSDNATRDIWERDSEKN